MLARPSQYVQVRREKEDLRSDQNAEDEHDDDKIHALAPGHVRIGTACAIAVAFERSQADPYSEERDYARRVVGCGKGCMRRSKGKPSGRDEGRISVLGGFGGLSWMRKTMGATADCNIPKIRT